MFSKDDFIKGIKNLLKNTEIIVEESDEKLIFKQDTKFYGSVQLRNNSTMTIAEIRNMDIESFISKYSVSPNIFRDYILSSERLFEVPVKFLSEISLREVVRAFRNMNTEKNDVKLEISFASFSYLLYFICNAAKGSDGISLKILSFFQKVNTIEEFLERILIFTAKIELNKDIDFDKTKELVQSYLFNIAFNYDIAMDINTFSQEKKSLRRLHRKETGQLFPYKQYNNDIIHYYYQGISTDSAFAQYLAFYHVVEFFFIDIVEKDIVKEIQDTITAPSFSPLKADSIKKFYKKIQKKFYKQKEDGIGNEKTALLLCLKEFIGDIEKLKEFIDRIDNNAIDYYQNNNVVFTDEGEKIDFSNIGDKTYTNICNRIYSTRNAIVHSKECEKPKYTPYKHDEDLYKEIPLIRAIAELVIINSAK